MGVVGDGDEGQVVAFLEEKSEYAILPRALNSSRFDFLNNLKNAITGLFCNRRILKVANEIFLKLGMISSRNWN